MFFYICLENTFAHIWRLNIMQLGRPHITFVSKIIVKLREINIFCDYCENVQTEKRLISHWWVQDKGIKRCKQIPFELAQITRFMNLAKLKAELCRIKILGTYQSHVIKSITLFCKYLYGLGDEHLFLCLTYYHPMFWYQISIYCMVRTINCFSVHE